MSGSTGLAATPLTDAERIDVRRFCGYPAYGAGSSGFQSWRFFEAFGTLEFRLTNLAPGELQVVRQFLATLYGLEQAVPAASVNLDTDQAAVWKHNSSEVAERTRLFDDWARRLIGFIGIPAGPAMRSVSAIII
ncbi:hypothetical protein HN018_10850 [Lichenicola cladoniae]|uniref:Uncharacterized protein n=1 Tax=Lichenicola cladoniae TaxID=1484109 RepID=A0A6M8HQ74_9PROT|nr:hypothetical protein [Lichenicola cladoniae]NPD67865.1 hypothetical protein [Acetobacteraceae bacterium]QKE90466.1 hypothetical protein HN018_10850 [Lichenicola cladoniae]